METYNLEVEEDFPCVRECPTTDDKGKDSHSKSSTPSAQPKTPMEQTLMIVESIQHMEKAISARLDMIYQEVKKLENTTEELSRIKAELSQHKDLLHDIRIYTKYR